MSQVALKNYLNTFDRAQLTQLVLEVLEECKITVGPLAANTKPIERLQQYADLIAPKAPPKHGIGNLSLRACKKAVKDTKEAKPAAKTIPELVESLSQAQLLQVLLKLYDEEPAAKAYLDPMVETDSDVRLKEFVAIIENEFFPEVGNATCSFVVCRKAIGDYKKLNPSPESMAELLVTLVENMCRYTDHKIACRKNYKISLESNYAAAMLHLVKHNLVSQYQDRMVKSALLCTSFGPWVINALLGYFERHGIELDLEQY